MTLTSNSTDFFLWSHLYFLPVGCAIMWEQCHVEKKETPRTCGLDFMSTQ